MESYAGIVPELYCSDFDASLEFYTSVCGFSIDYSRAEDRFAYLRRGEARLMIEQTRDPSRRFVAAELTYPFGRGMSLEIPVDDASTLYDSVVARRVRIFLTLEERWYRRGEVEVGNLQFVAMDPDGYLLRFAQHLGQREGSA